MSLPTIILLLVCSSLLSFIIIRLFQPWASRWLVDIPNERSSHMKPTPKGGGVGITGAITLIAIPIFVVQGQWYLLICLIGAIIIAIVGFIDDIRQLSAFFRLLIQIVISTSVVLVVGSVTQIGITPLITVTLPFILALPISIFWLMAVTNIYNFMDGIDGFAGIQAVIAGSAWMFLFFKMQEHDLALLSGLIATGSLSFLYWNFPPAKLFMGDVGSTFLGFSFGALPLLGYSRFDDPRFLLIGLLFIGAFLFDGALTIFRRIVLGDNILTPHRTHLYQRLAKAGYSHQIINLIYFPLMLLSVFTGFAIWYAVSWFPILLIILIAFFNALVLYITIIERRHTIIQT